MTIPMVIIFCYRILFGQSVSQSVSFFAFLPLFQAFFLPFLSFSSSYSFLTLNFYYSFVILLKSVVSSFCLSSFSQSSSFCCLLPFFTNPFSLHLLLYLSFLQTPILPSSISLFSSSSFLLLSLLPSFLPTKPLIP